MARTFIDCSFACPKEDAELAVAVLYRWPCVDDTTVSYSDGRLRYRIDLASIPKGDGPSVELAIKRHLERCIAIHSAQ